MVVARSVHEIEAFATRRKWEIPSYEDFERWLQTEFDPLFFKGMPGYDFWTYLRHHGFPSPLLDWTRSPYIALFFALQDIRHDDEEGWTQ
jgi:hypothetical protein